MLRLFSSIRKSLIAENKTVKYMKYAVGEILLIVIGILIAVQINNWNEGRKDAVLREDYIRKLTEDIKRDIATNKLRLGTAKIHTEFADLLINCLNDPSMAQHNPVEFLAAFDFAGKYYPPTFYTDTLDELQSTGNMRLLEEDLKAELLYYYGLESLLKATDPRWEFRATKFEEYSSGILNPEQQLWLQENFDAITNSEQLAANKNLKVNPTWVNDSLTRLREDEDLIAWIPKIRRQQMTIQSLLQQTLDAAHAVLETLKAAQKESD